MATVPDDPDQPESVIDALRELTGVQLTGVDVVHGGDAQRPVFDELRRVPGEADTVVSVQLRHRGRLVTGTAQGPSTPQAAPRTAARATLAALHELLGDAVRLRLEWTHLLEAQAPEDPEVVNVVVVFMVAEETQRLAGAALMRGDVYDCAVRATLAASNRRLAPFLGA